MLETPHVIVGSAIAYKIANPALAIPLALGSHFILEKIPHWNPHLNTEKKKFGQITPKTKKIVIIDSTIALISGLFIASLTLPNINHFIIVVLAGFFSSLPDIIEAPYFFLNMENELIKNYVKFQKKLQVDTSIIPGLLTQVVTIIASILWIMK